MNKLKKITASVMAIVLVICIGYFSTLSPTTAWSFQSQNMSGAEKTFVFANFDVNGEYKVTDTIRFKGATKLNDESETHFDDVVEITEVQVTNDGGMPARIYVTVDNEYKTQGLRYFYFTDEIMVDNSVKATIKKALGDDMTAENLDRHNVGEDGNSGYYILMNPGETKTIKVALWVDYDESGIEFLKAESTWATISYRINMTMTATQDMDVALVR